VRIENGRYMTPERPGYSIEMRPGSLKEFKFPIGKAWAAPERTIARSARQRPNGSGSGS
jgi:hypothetical protein